MPRKKRKAVSDVPIRHVILSEASPVHDVQLENRGNSEHEDETYRERVLEL